MADPTQGDPAQGGTTYDQLGYDVHLTNQRALNGAQALPGYTPDVRPDGSWPGLDGSTDIRLKDADAAQVESTLRTRAGTTQSLPAWLAAGTNVSFGPASWHEANNLKAASGMVSDAVTKFIGEVVANMNQAADSVRTARETYATQDHKSASTFQDTNASLG